MTPGTILGIQLGLSPTFKTSYRLQKIHLLGERFVGRSGGDFFLMKNDDFFENFDFSIFDTKIVPGTITIVLSIKNDSD